MSQENSAAENKMATKPMGKLMLTMGLPIVLSMMLQAVYNIVDSAFLSNMSEAGEEALTALGLAFPIQLLMIAISIGTGVGANALLSRFLGQGNKEGASKTCGNAIFMGIVIYIIFLLVGFFVVKPYVNSQNVAGNISDTVINMAIDYLHICCCISFGQVFYAIFEKLLQATGRSVKSTIAQVTGALVNIVFDPIFIYGWFGLPAMGVKGAAIATVFGQIVSAVLAVIFYIRNVKEVDKSPRYIRPNWKILKSLYAIGLPAIISQALLTVMTYGMNIILGRIGEVGENAVTVYGLYCKIQQLIVFAAVGMRDAITPIVSFSYGQGNPKRLKEGIKFGMIYTVILMILGTVIIEALAGPLTKFFSLSEPTYSMCVDCMRIISLGFIFSGISIAFQGVFQAIGRGVESLIISLGRQVVFILPVAWLLTRTVTGAENIANVWWTFLIGETLTLITAIIMFIRKPVQKRVNIQSEQTA